MDFLTRAMSGQLKISEIPSNTISRDILEDGVTPTRRGDAQVLFADSYTISFVLATFNDSYFRGHLRTPTVKVFES